MSRKNILKLKGLDLFRAWKELESFIDYNFLEFHNTSYEGFVHHSDISVDKLIELRNLINSVIYYKLLDKEEKLC